MKKIKASYIISLPERSIKSLVAMTTGVTSLVTKLLLPDALKDSATYRVTFGMLQQFLIEKVAQVEDTEKEIILKDKYLVRKTAGSIIEGIGLISIRFSPVWMLAILSDISGGSKVYLARLIYDLKKNKLIDETTNYDNVYELLEGIKSSSKIGVNAIDMPPISIDEFKEFKNELVQQFKENTQSSHKVYKDLEVIYNRMSETSKKEKMSFTKLNGAMTLDLMRKSTKKGFDITSVTARTSLDLMNELFIQSYSSSLDKLNRIGKRKYLIEHMSPFVKMFKEHYSEDKKTLTESFIGLFHKKEKNS